MNDDPKVLKQMAAMLVRENICMVCMRESGRDCEIWENGMDTECPDIGRNFKPVFDTWYAEAKAEPLGEADNAD